MAMKHQNVGQNSPFLSSPVMVRGPIVAKTKKTLKKLE
jgi:hypothetical protein